MCSLLLLTWCPALTFQVLVASWFFPRRCRRGSQAPIPSAHSALSRRFLATRASSVSGAIRLALLLGCWAGPAWTSSWRSRNSSSQGRTARLYTADRERSRTLGATVSPAHLRGTPARKATVHKDQGTAVPCGVFRLVHMRSSPLTDMNKDECTSQCTTGI